jgi:hypothetical protein
MDPLAELEYIENQIVIIKNNSEYQRLLTSHRGIKDDQRFKAYTLQLQTLGLKKDKLAINKNSKYTPNGRIVQSIRKPTVSTTTIHTAPKSEINVAAPPPINHLKKTVHQGLVNTKSPIPKGRTKPKGPAEDVEEEAVPELPKTVSTAGRTIVRVIEEPPIPEEPMIKPTRTSIKPGKVPVSKVAEIKAAQKAKTHRKLGSSQDSDQSDKSVKSTKPMAKPIKVARTIHKDNIEDIDDLDINSMDQLLETDDDF